MHDTALIAPNPLPLLMRVVALQMLRRKDAYLLGLILLVFGAGAGIARFLGIETTEMARFLASLGFTLSSSASALLLIIVAPQLLPAEIESRTIYPILAKPVGRAEFLAGKWIPILLLASVMLLLGCVITLVTAPKLPLQDPFALFQAFFLQFIALAVLSALMLALSLYMPVGLAIVIGLFGYFFGPTVLSVASNTLAESPLRYLCFLPPDFSLLNHFQRYVDGAAPLDFVSFIFVAVYGALWTFVFSGIAVRRFSGLAL